HALRPARPGRGGGRRALGWLWALYSADPESRLSPAKRRRVSKDRPPAALDLHPTQGLGESLAPRRERRGASGVGRGIEPGRAPGEDLAAVLGDPDRMLELGGKASIAGDRGPAVVEDLGGGLADVDHRLDGEEHARPKLGPGAGAAGVDHLRRV